MRGSSETVAVVLASSIVAAVSLTAQETPRQEPLGLGQLKSPPVRIEGGVGEQGMPFSYLGQPAVNAKLVLTASNGFFTKGVCQAAGKSDLPKVGDESLIAPNFGWLERWQRSDGTLHWYFHAARPGTVRLRTWLEVATGEEGSEIEVSVGAEVKSVRTEVSNAGSPQSWDLDFEVPEQGEYRVALRAQHITNADTGVGKLHRVELVGPALEGAHLLRVRWRPAAVHGGYAASQVGASRLLVMTTRSVAPVSSYSPVTTPFGYFGTSFTAEGRSNGQFNFSMWGGAEAAEDLRRMPHLLGVGSPDGEFSGFGHEGSGVKPRGWTPMPDGPELVVQALRVKPGETYDTYYGYYFDHPSGDWKFYAAGNKWHGGKPTTHLRVGSFCEVPGPPQVERTGDVYREVRRRGWYFVDGEWVTMDRFTPGGAGSKGDQAVNKRWHTTADGEFAMGCGGIRLYTAEAPEALSPGGELPYFLTDDSVDQLHTVPIEFGEIRVAKLTGRRAMLEVSIASRHDIHGGAVYFGTVDALTFAPRQLHGTEKKSALSQAVQAGTWQRRQAFANLSDGMNRIQLDDLEPETTYYFRVLIRNAVSQIWNAETLSFTTPPDSPGAGVDLPATR